MSEITHRCTKLVRLTFCFIGQEAIDLFCGTVVGDNGETFVVHVKDQVLALEMDEGRVSVSRVILHTMTAKPMRPMSPLESTLAKVRAGQRKDLRCHD